MSFDWHAFRAARFAAPAIVDSRRRLRICLAGFVLLAGLVFGRIVHLEVMAGAAFRQQAGQPIERTFAVAPQRGRILDRNGQVLAGDRTVSGLAVHYRYLQEPCDGAWLRSVARGRLTAAQRKQSERVAAESQQVLAERGALWSQVAQITGLTAAEWERRRQTVQARVERIVQSVERRREAAAGRAAEAAARRAAEAQDSWGAFFWETLQASTEVAAPGRVVVAEQRQYHLMVDEVSPDVAAQIQAHAQQFPGVKIVSRRERSYPGGALAAHVLGHLGPPPEDRLAPGEPQTGLERQYESLLRGQPGTGLELLDHAGRALSTERTKDPVSGSDLALTLDVRVQQAAESLLDQALERRAVTELTAAPVPAGGAIVVLDVRDGAVLAAASAPRFEPGWFSRGDSPNIERTLRDPAHPLFDRVSAMAIAPGSVFKIVTAIALLESERWNPAATLDCRGYLDTPDRWRCARFMRHGRGHGAVALGDALAQSCNVYFFEQARRLGPQPLCAWGARLGFGQSTGIDLPGEARGTLPAPPDASDEQGPRWRTANTLELCIGQGSLTATPLQIARLLAAVANGGRLVTPHLVARVRRPSDAADEPVNTPISQPVAGLHAHTLAELRRGLERVVADPQGTAYDTVRLDSVAVAGKTGTAQTGAGRADHAWFAGYFPVADPRWAVVVVLEHVGSAATAAGPPARQLIQQMRHWDR